MEEPDKTGSPKVRTIILSSEVIARGVGVEVGLELMRFLFLNTPPPIDDPVGLGRLETSDGRRVFFFF